MPPKNSISTAKPKLEIVQIKKPKIEPEVDVTPVQELKKIELPPKKTAKIQEKNKVLAVQKFPKQEFKNKDVVAENPQEQESKKNVAVAEKPPQREKKKKEPKSENTEPEQKQEKDLKPKPPIFQAIGVILGEIKFTGNDGTITIDGETYCLVPSPLGRRGYKLDELAKQIRESGQALQRISVYPKVTRAPGRSDYIVSWCVVGVDKKGSPPLSECSENEFRLSGLWQYVENYPLPCISVKRNFSPDMMRFVEKLTDYEKQKIAKPMHLPLIWENGLEPFRYNTELSKEENGKPLFVSLKARFFPKSNVFEFVEQLAEPLEKAPKSYKPY